jgi:CheY-like chemotaxis protein
LVEDNATNQKVALYQLQKLGYAADAVANGVEALEALERASYDIVLMDCLMPEMDGYEATRRIRRREGQARHTAIIAMTAGAFESDRLRCLSAGMDDYLSKPVSEQDLAKVLIRWAEGGAGMRPGANEIGHAPEAPTAGVLQRLRELRAVSEPHLFTEFIDGVIGDVQDGLEQLGRALSQRDFQTLSKRAHTLKSICGSIGAKGMMEACQFVEERAKAGSAGGLGVVIGSLKEDFEAVRLILEQEREAP